MKKLTLPTGGSLTTTLALMLLLIVAVCENDDENPIKSVPVANPVLKIHLGGDLNTVVGESITLSASTSFGQKFNPPS